MNENPYLKKVIRKTILSYNSNYGDERICECGHPYYRHFDTYEQMSPVGCKYCGCFKFKEVSIKTCSSCKIKNCDKIPGSKSCTDGLDAHAN